MRIHRWSLLLLAVIGVIALAERPRAQAPAAAFYRVADPPGGSLGNGATTIIRDATKSGGVISAVGGAVTRQTNCGNVLANPGPCSGTDTPILWRFDGINPATIQALPDIDPNIAAPFTLSGASAIGHDGRYVASQARITPSGARAVRVDALSLTNLNLNTTFVPALPANVTSTLASATSADGTILYGTGTLLIAPGTFVTRAMRFDTTAATSLFIPLVGTDTANNVAARGASADGSVVVGLSSGGGQFHAFRYKHGSGLTVIPLLPGGTINNPTAVSPDGDLVLLNGNSSDNPNPEPYLWRASTNAIQRLGSPNAPYRAGGRICANRICTPALSVQAGMTADGAVVATNFTNPAGPPEAGHAYFHNVHGWFHLASVLGANGIDIGADGWQNLLITGMSSDGTLVFGGGEHNGVFEGFVAEFAPGVLASFNPQPVKPSNTSLVGVWALCEPDECDGIVPGVDLAVVVFTDGGAYYEVEPEGFERGFYTYDGNVLSITTLVDTDGVRGFSFGNGMHFGPIVVSGDTLAPGGPLGGIRFPGKIAEPLVGGWVGGDPTLPGSALLVGLGADFGNQYMFAIDDPPNRQSEVGTYTWDPNTHELTAYPDGGVPNPRNFVTPTANGLGLHLVDDKGPEFDFVRVIDPTTIPKINSPLSADGVVNQAFNHTVTATNTVVFSTTGLPAGLSIDGSTGHISGAPTVGGQFGVTVKATSAAGVSDIETLVLTIAIPTPVGQNVIVQPQVPEGQGPVTLTFGEITSGGETKVTIVDQSEVPPPGNVEIGGVIYEVTTTATYQGLITLCFSYEGIDFGTAEPRLFHFENNVWVDITTSVDSTTQTICGATTTLSPFAVLRSHVVRKGFRAPLNPIAGFLNTVKGGSAVPLKFNVYVDGVEQKTTTGLTMTVQTLACDSNAPQDPVDFTVAGETSLRYDTTGGYFIQNWKVPKTPGCYMVRFTTAQDGLALTARFSVK